ncbi:MAG: DUF4342 domain-containing protein [Oscillospiraceae bacterium]|nr:DUF4342 domain-containing protein [Oscillospiraceae bacterium]
MDIDLVEQLRSRANVTYDDAREALDACGGDLLDAVIYLEKQGKVAPPSGGGSYSSKEHAQPQNSGSRKSKEPQGESFSYHFGRFLRWLGAALQMSCDYSFVVKRGGEVIISIPVLAFILLLAFAFWFAIIAFITGLFFNCSYSIASPAGKAKKTEKEVMGEVKREIYEVKREISEAADAADEVTSGVNAVMEEIAEVTRRLKSEFQGRMGE